MLSQSIYTDIVINTKDGSIGAHCAVLANSTVFHAMFSNDYKEKELSTINISDMSIEACKAMVNFVYGKRESNELRAHGMELYKAADKYDILDLKKACEASLCEDVGKNNVFERLQFAYTHDLRELKSMCLFILVKVGMMFGLPEDYKAFLKEANRELIAEFKNAFLETSPSHEVIDEFLSAWLDVWKGS